MQRLLRTFLKTAQSLLSANHFDGRRNPKRRRRLNSTDPLEERCLLALGDVVRQFNLYTPETHPGLQDQVRVAAVGDRVLASYQLGDVADKSKRLTGAVALFDANSGSQLASFPDPLTSDDGHFAAEIAMTSSNVAIVQSRGPHTAGAVYIYDLQGNFQREIADPAPFANHYFGDAISVFGDFLLVGAGSRFDGPQGTAYLFRISTGSLLRELESPSSKATGAYGRSVALNADKIVVSDVLEDALDDYGSAGGTVYEFGFDGPLQRSWSNPATTELAQLFGDNLAVYGNDIFTSTFDRDFTRNGVNYVLTDSEIRRSLIATEDPQGVSIGSAADATNQTFSRHFTTSTDIVSSITVLPNFPVVGFSNSGGDFTFTRGAQNVFPINGDVFGYSLSVSSGFVVASSALNGRPTCSKHSMIFDLMGPQPRRM